ncbi:hypothetical protein FACS1894216_14860 [Synergistales bacterium]|nr:hypothetical protein FACS1894216_14860 [Synergistales bacterium]
MGQVGLTIRPAMPYEADRLSHICFRAMAYRGSTTELLNGLEETDHFSVSPDDIEANMAYVAEDEEEGDAVGFYLMRASENECVVNKFYVIPESVGEDARAHLFFHACEMAETAGAECLTIEAEPEAMGFFEEMGAEPIGDSRAGAKFALLRLRL